MDLAAKAQLAVTAANKRMLEEVDPDSEGEYSHYYHRSKKLQSGLNVKVAHKVKVETEWAHHNLGREFEANPVGYNQLKLGQYMMGEAEIILSCRNPVEKQCRLVLMKKIGYWQYKYDWPTAQNIYAAILRAIETQKASWENLDIREYEDMLGTVRNREEGSKGVKRVRDTFFCAAYQKGECKEDSPHTARVGTDGPERFVHHICSTCLLKDGKKLSHASGSPACPKSKA